MRLCHPIRLKLWDAAHKLQNLLLSLLGVWVTEFSEKQEKQ